MLDTLTKLFFHISAPFVTSPSLESILCNIPQDFVGECVKFVTSGQIPDNALEQTINTIFRWPITEITCK